MKVCLVILDGWGYNKIKIKEDAIDSSKCENMRQLSKIYPSYLVHASGKHVGLPENSMGNSEVGHLTIGSGRIVKQNITRIGKSIADGTLKNKLKTIMDLKFSYIHVIIMISDGGIHSHLDHLFGVLEIIKYNFQTIYIHCITDGRDTEPRVALKFIKTIEQYVNENKNCIIVTVSGRYYAMDRNNNVNRTERYFNVLTTPTETVKDLKNHIELLYKNNLNDENLLPFRVCSQGVVKKDDHLLFLNFRSDRMRQIVEKFLVNGNKIFTIVEYKKDLPVEVIFKEYEICNTLAEVLSNNEIFHTHIAESEKYAHVTYFLNGRREKKFSKEKRIIIESPNVESFDEVPEMSSYKIKDAVIKETINLTPFIVANFASPDMIAHTGNLSATKKAIEIVDICIGEIYKSCINNNYVLIITADHGNAEMMFDKNNNCISKKHTSNKVPLIICNEKVDEKEGFWGYRDSDYALYDIAPTILDLFELIKPTEMTGKSLIK